MEGNILKWFKVSITILFILIWLSPINTLADSQLNKIKDVAENYYVDPITTEMLAADSTDEFLEHLDLYSILFTKKEFDTFMDSIENNYVGIGISIQIVEDKIIIQEVFQSTPAEEAGIKAQDQIIEVDGQSTAELSLDEVVALIKGKAGSYVSLTLKHKNDQNTYKTKAERGKIELPTVTYTKMGGNIGYITISSFNLKTVPEVTEIVNEHRNEVSGWIIDLRNNPGGYLRAAQQLLGLFPRVSNALWVESKDHMYPIGPISQETHIDKQSIFLINEYSASASEIVAGAIQDSKVAKLYGSTTFGKGLMQELFTLESGDVLKLSTNRFYTPNKNIIQKEGIKPDVQSNQPLQQAHKDLLNAKHYNYKKIAKLVVNPDKTFTIRFNSNINLQTIKNNIHLIGFGMEGEIPFTVARGNDFNSITVDPTSPLISGETYELLIDPGYASLRGTTSTKGSRVIIEVK